MKPLTRGETRWITISTLLNLVHRVFSFFKTLRRPWERGWACAINREEKSLRHVAVVAKFLDDNKPIKSLKSLFALFQTSPILFNFIILANLVEISLEPYLSLAKFRKRKRQFHDFCVVFTYSIKWACEIRKFHVVVVQRWQRNVQNSVIHEQSCCLLTYYFLPFSLPSLDYEQSLWFLCTSSKTPKTRKWPRTPLIKSEEKERLLTVYAVAVVVGFVVVTWHHTSPLYKIWTSLCRLRVAVAVQGPRRRGDVYIFRG